MRTRPVPARMSLSALRLVTACVVILMLSAAPEARSAEPGRFAPYNRAIAVLRCVHPTCYAERAPALARAADTLARQAAAGYPECPEAARFDTLAARRWILAAREIAAGAYPAGRRRVRAGIRAWYDTGAVFFACEIGPP